MTIAPFLYPPFSPDTPVTIAAGWKYDEWEIAIHGVTRHEAVDFSLAQGTPVLAAADGLAIATFGERLQKHDGKPRQHKGQNVYYGNGLMVQIWHGQGRYTQYLHLDTIDSNIPFYPPWTDEHGDLQNAPELRALVKSYGKEVTAYPVKAGETIGTVGCTGLGLGKRTYEQWQHHDFSYHSWDTPHLHFTVFGPRAPYTRNAMRYDPFGIKGHAAEYPATIKAWPTLPNSLWLQS